MNDTLKKILILGIAVLMLFTGCRSRETISVEKTTEPDRVNVFIQYGPFGFKLAYPEELSEYVQQCVDEYEFPEEVMNSVPEGFRDQMVIRCEVVEAADVVVEMPKDYDGFCDIFFYPEDHHEELEALGGICYSITTDYIDKDGKYLCIGLKPQCDFDRVEEGKGVINYLQMKINAEFIIYANN